MSQVGTTQTLRDRIEARRAAMAQTAAPAPSLRSRIEARRAAMAASTAQTAQSPGMLAGSVSGYQQPTGAGAFDRPAVQAPGPRQGMLENFGIGLAQRIPIAAADVLTLVRGGFEASNDPAAAVLPAVGNTLDMVSPGLQGAGGNLANQAVDSLAAPPRSPMLNAVSGALGERADVLRTIGNAPVAAYDAAMGGTPSPFSGAGIARAAGGTMIDMGASMGGGLVGGAIGGPAGAAAGAFAPNMLSQWASGMAETANRIMEANPAMDQREALARAFGVSGTAAVPAALLDSLTGAEGAVAKVGTNTLGGTIRRGVGTVGRSMLEEGLTEPSQSVIQDVGGLAAQPIRGQLPDDAVGQYATGKAAEAVVGGLMGGAGGGVAVATDAYGQRRKVQQRPTPPAQAPTVPDGPDPSAPLLDDLRADWNQQATRDDDAANAYIERLWDELSGPEQVAAEKADAAVMPGATGQVAPPVPGVEEAAPDLATMEEPEAVSRGRQLSPDGMSNLRRKMLARRQASRASSQARQMQAEQDATIGRQVAPLDRAAADAIGEAYAPEVTPEVTPEVPDAGKKVAKPATYAESLRAQAAELDARADALSNKASRRFDNAPGAAVTGGSGRVRSGLQKKTNQAIEGSLNDIRKAKELKARASDLRAKADRNDPVQIAKEQARKDTREKAIEASRKRESDERKAAPLVNIDATGAVRMTKAEWAKTPNDYKAVSVRNGVRVRTVVRGGSLSEVFITDAPATKTPTPTPVAAQTSTSAPVIGAQSSERESGGGTREPWEMTRAEFSADGAKQVAAANKARDAAMKAAGNLVRSTPNGVVLTVPTLQDRRASAAVDADAKARELSRNYSAYAHSVSVGRALSEGKPVPASVLADYPDLANPPAKPDSSPKSEPALEGSAATDSRKGMAIISERVRPHLQMFENAGDMKQQLRGLMIQWVNGGKAPPRTAGTKTGVPFSAQQTRQPLELAAKLANETGRVHSVVQIVDDADKVLGQAVIEAPQIDGENESLTNPQVFAWDRLLGGAVHIWPGYRVGERNTLERVRTPKSELTPVASMDRAALLAELGEKKNKPLAKGDRVLVKFASDGEFGTKEWEVQTTSPVLVVREANADPRTADYHTTNEKMVKRVGGIVGTVKKLREMVAAKRAKDSATKNAEAVKSGARKNEQTDTIAGSMNLDEFEAKGYAPDEVTRAEWVAMQRANRRYLGQNENSGTAASPNADYENFHEDAVRGAIARGEEVDERVLKDYPKLSKPSKGGQTAAKGNFYAGAKGILASAIDMGPETPAPSPKSTATPDDGEMYEGDHIEALTPGGGMFSGEVTKTGLPGGYVYIIPDGAKNAVTATPHRLLKGGKARERAEAERVRAAKQEAESEAARKAVDAEMAKPVPATVTAAAAEWGLTVERYEMGMYANKYVVWKITDPKGWDTNSKDGGKSNDGTAQSALDAIRAAAIKRGWLEPASGRTGAYTKTKAGKQRIESAKPKKAEATPGDTQRNPIERFKVGDKVRIRNGAEVFTVTEVQTRATRNEVEAERIRSAKLNAAFEGVDSGSTETEPPYLRNYTLSGPKSRDNTKGLYSADDAMLSRADEAAPATGAEAAKVEAAAPSDTPPAPKKAWEKTQPEFMRSGIKSLLLQYYKAIERGKEELKTRIPSKRRRQLEVSIPVWEARYESMKKHESDLDSSQWDDIRQQYVATVKKAISTGEKVPAAIVDANPEFKKAVTARARYDKGRNTSFGNITAAVDTTMLKERGVKVKRQDGTTITPEEVKAMGAAVAEIEEAVGPLADVMRHTGLTIVHTRGKYPFMEGNASGLYHPTDRSVSYGTVIGPFETKALAHEMGHWMDYEGGKALGVEATARNRQGKVLGGGKISSLSENSRNYSIAEELKPDKELMAKAAQTMSDPWMASKIAKKNASKIEDADEKNQLKAQQFKLTSYWREPREIWARLFEQYVATKRGKSGASHETAAYYESAPAWWSKAEFAKLMPMIEEAIRRRVAPMESAKVEGVSGTVTEKIAAWADATEKDARAKLRTKAAMNKGKMSSGIDPIDQAENAYQIGRWAAALVVRSGVKVAQAVLQIAGKVGPVPLRARKAAEAITNQIIEAAGKEPTEEALTRAARDVEAEHLDAQAARLERLAKGEESTAAAGTDPEGRYKAAEAARQQAAELRAQADKVRATPKPEKAPKPAKADQRPASVKASRQRVILTAAVAAAYKAAKQIQSGGKVGKVRLGKMVDEVIARQPWMKGERAGIMRAARALLKDAGNDPAKVTDAHAAAMKELSERVAAFREAKQARAKLVAEMTKDGPDAQISGRAAMKERLRATGKLMTKMQTQGAKAVAAAIRQTKQAGRAEAAAKIATLREKIRAERKRQTDMRRIETRGKVDAARDAERDRAALQQGLRDELVRLIRENMPRELRGKYLTAVRDVKTLARLGIEAGKLERDLLEHMAKQQIRQAEKAAGTASTRMELEPELREQLNAAVGQLQTLKRRLRTLGSGGSLTTAAGGTANASTERVTAADLRVLLDDIENAARAILSARFQQKNLDMVRIKGELVAAKEIREGMITSLESQPDLPRSGTKTVETGWLLRQLRRRTNWDSMMQMLDGGVRAGPFRRLFGEVEKGRNDALELDHQFRDLMGEIVQKHGYESSSRMLAEVSGSLGENLQKTVQAKSGGKVRTMTLGQAMYLYASSEDTGFIARIQKGQKIQFGTQRTSDPISITEDDLASVAKALTPAQRAMVDELKAAYDRHYFEKLSSVNKRLKGVFLEKVPGYWGIKLNREFSEMRGTPTSWRGNYIAAMEEAGYMQERLGPSKTPILIGDFGMDILTRSKSASTTIGKAERVKLLMQTLLHPETVQRITAKYGAETIERLKRRIAEWSGGTTYSPIGRVWREMLSMWARAKTQLRFPTWIRNAVGSASRMLNELGVKDVASTAFRPSVAAYRELMQYSPAARERWAGGSAGNFYDTLNNDFADAAFKDAGTATIRNLAGIAKAVATLDKDAATASAAGAWRSWRKTLDAITVSNYFDAHGAVVAYRVLLEKAPKDWPELKRKKWAARRAMRAFERTANTATIEYANDIQLDARENTLIGMMTAFTGDTAKAMNMIYQAYARAAAGEISWGKAARTALVLLFGSAMSGLVSAAWAALLGKGYDKAKASAQNRFIQEAVSLVPGGGLGVNAIQKYLATESTDSLLDVPMVDLVNYGGRALHELYKATEAPTRKVRKDTVTANDRYMRALLQSSKLLDAAGIPSQYIFDTKTAIDNWSK